jgi:ankyrin repeat protein
MKEITRLPFKASQDEYDAQAAQLLEAFRTGDEKAITLVWHKHPRFLDEKITWLPKRLSRDDVRRVPLDRADAELALARWYDFRTWDDLRQYVEAVHVDGSPFARFESAVEAVINGDVTTLSSLLRAHPDLTTARSSRATPFDPPFHRATLLHYVAANGVEGHRQKSPPNAPEVARTLLAGGAEPDALADMYGGRCTTMSMLVSSSPPAIAGVQVPLVDVLVDYGAAVDPRGEGSWTSPLITALVFGFQDAAQALVRRGARVETLPAAAGLGRLEVARRLLPSANADDRHRALALAAQLGHAEVVGMLLDAGEDPSRYNPNGLHAHGTPLHQAVWAGRDAVVRLLVERGARLDIKDTIYQGTPLGWAVYGGRTAIAEYLRAHGAT